jgi:hypothetical protein
MPARVQAAWKGFRILPREWTEVDVVGPAPHIYLPRTKNGRSKRLALADEDISAIKELSQTHFYVPLNRTFAFESHLPLNSTG